MKELRPITEAYKNKLDRITNFDLLRGFFIFQALWQHFCFYLNVWYTTFFRDTSVLNYGYQVHKSMIGNNLPLDYLTYLTAWFFTPWVSQIYLTLAAFNLSRKSQEEFKQTYWGKMKVFLLILIFFTFENFLVAPNFGEAISFYPIMAWMYILAAIATLYRFFGVKAIWGLLLISFTRWLIPEITILHNLVGFIQTYIHDSYEFDAQIDYFLSSGCVGFLMGYYYHHRDMGAKRELSLIGVGSFLILIWYIFGEANTMNYYNIFDTEHFMAESVLGTICILGVQLALLSLFLLFEKYYSFSPRVPVFNYVGEQSLSIFALHRIMFVFIFAPIMIFIGTIFDHPLLNNVGVAWTCCALVFLTNWFIKKSKIHEVILGS
ncbi:MAG: hypothetical protein HN576_08135 [Bacteriovoracaceae bacterium]|jgi:hypothetical protein|nr:hypothetical protein [Bacteriovoracaceae bacterium]